ncbi:MAG: tRNA (N(6)-L-threonylcarbamoyladenosine(37)-C(2))-methylthiotransferase MtaB [Armatimonadota bacterium]|nr:tRNA (N(6)-L-threonylcarbamoyladenosine(37)-C(2))-methylthiotransferase MtaB [bacterium]
MKMPTIAYHTLGCKVNQYETEKIREALERAGFETTAFSSRSDAYVINTCSVTSIADSKSRAAIRRTLKLNPDAYVVVAGCYAQLEPDQIRTIEGVGLVVAHEEKDNIPERIIAHFGCTDTHHPTSGGRPRPRMRTRAVVKVQDGCDQFCAYCVIPYARVGKTSRPLNDVLDELRLLAEFGYKEIVFAGIRLGSYEDGDIRLPQLIEHATRIDGIERIRLSSIEPWEVGNELLDTMIHPKVCRHLHIPLQSGDDDTLRRMNRPYTASDYLGIIERVRARIDGIGITTDVIAGFPGETDGEFNNTCALIELVDFSRLHVFRYSPRPGTRAAALPGHIDAHAKKLRAQTLIEIGRRAMIRFASSQIGNTLEVLAGLTDNYIEVAFAGDAPPKGEIVRARIDGVDEKGAVQAVLISNF